MDLKDVKKKLGITLIGGIITITSFAPICTHAATPYAYKSKAFWHSVYANGGNTFYLSSGDSSIINGSQSLYKGSVLSVEYGLENQSNYIVSKHVAYNAYDRNLNFNFDHVSPGYYKLKFTNLHDNDKTGISLSGNFGY